MDFLNIPDYEESGDSILEEDIVENSDAPHYKWKVGIVNNAILSDKFTYTTIIYNKFLDQLRERYPSKS